MIEFLKKLDNNLRCNIETIAIERTKEIVINLTELYCELDDIYCYDKKELTVEAKEIYDILFEEEYNKQLKIIEDIINIVNESKCSC